MILPVKCPQKFLRESHQVITQDQRCQLNCFCMAVFLNIVQCHILQHKLIKGNELNLVQPVCWVAICCVSSAYAKIPSLNKVPVPLTASLKIWSNVGEASSHNRSRSSCSAGTLCRRSSPKVLDRVSRPPVSSYQMTASSVEGTRQRSITPVQLLHCATTSGTPFRGIGWLFQALTNFSIPASAAPIVTTDEANRCIPSVRSNRSVLTKSFSKLFNG